jgi:hypothetical protein
MYTLIKKYCDNSARKIHISNNFILNYKFSDNVWHLITKTITTLQHSATLHYTSLYFTTLIDTSLPLVYISLPFRLALRIYISYHSISLHSHITSTDLIPKIISKKVNPFTALKNFSPFHFTSLHFLFYLFVYLSFNPTLHFTLLFLTTSYFPSPHLPSLFTFYRLYFP